MLKYRNILLGLAVAGALCGTAAHAAGPHGLGREALPEEVEAWNTDVRPDGQGLPEGSGSVLDGEAVFADQCAVCHGDFAEGVDRWPVLAGGQGTLKSQNPVKTIGSYWPYLSTAYDYIERAMPFGNARSLSADEVYAIVAYLLYMNDLVDDEFVLSKENFTEVRLPNEENFIADDRPDTPSVAQAEPCMTNCKENVEITARARIIDVTPEDAGVPEEDASETEESAAAEEPAAQEEQVAAAAPALDAGLVDEGEGVFKKKCRSCHSVEEGKQKVGPSLHAVYGQAAAEVEGFKKYSKALKSAGLTWDAATLDQFLTKPKGLVKGTKMSFAGLKKDGERAAVIEYLKSLTPTN
ncbi:c-type cytochrome [Hwanghaeella sp.]|uniref:c-type cytochrome n=1 Tax=Hwanghaeella sp. TaxID=2605943 RepID=UPI003CCB86B1